MSCGSLLRSAEDGQGAQSASGDVGAENTWTWWSPICKWQQTSDGVGYSELRRWIYVFGRGEHRLRDGRKRSSNVLLVRSAHNTMLPIDKCLTLTPHHTHIGVYRDCRQGGTCRATQQSEEAETRFLRCRARVFEFVFHIIVYTCRLPMLSC